MGPLKEGRPPPCLRATKNVRVLVSVANRFRTPFWAPGSLTATAPTQGRGGGDRNSSLENTPREAPWFYIVYAAVLLTGMAIALSGVNIVDLNIGIQAMNALLPPRHGDSAIPAPHLASCFDFAGQASVKGSFGSRMCGP